MFGGSGLLFHIQETDTQNWIGSSPCIIGAPWVRSFSIDGVGSHPFIWRNPCLSVQRHYVETFPPGLLSSLGRRLLVNASWLAFSPAGENCRPCVLICFHFWAFSCGSVLSLNHIPFRVLVKGMWGEVGEGRAWHRWLPSCRRRRKGSGLQPLHVLLPSIIPPALSPTSCPRCPQTKELAPFPFVSPSSWARRW